MGKSLPFRIADFIPLCCIVETWYDLSKLPKWKSVILWLLSMWSYHVSLNWMRQVGTSNKHCQTHQWMAGRTGERLNYLNSIIITQFKTQLLFKIEERCKMSLCILKKRWTVPLIPNPHPQVTFIIINGYENDFHVQLDSSHNYNQTWKPHSPQSFSHSIPWGRIKRKQKCAGRMIRWFTFSPLQSVIMQV